MDGWDRLRQPLLPEEKFINKGTPMKVSAEMQALWDELPSMACIGKCQTCCGPIDMSPHERELTQAAGVEIQPMTPMRVAMWGQDAKFDLLGRPLWCNALDLTTGGCTVYEVRPTVCRLWGASESMPCPHGCKPTKMLTDLEAMTHLVRSMVIGGKFTQEEADEALAILSDPEVAAATGALMRGEAPPAGAHDLIDRKRRER